tara:strand:- start:8001 stop:8426 length:426 start_codon:yes stop_codon:yes gene_type:complete
MPETLNPTEIADKQANRLSAAVPDIKRGVQRVTQSPTDKAADNLEKAASNYALAISSGKTEQRLRAVSLSDWQQATVAKADRIPSGINEAKAKLQKFHAQRQGHQTGIDSELDSMPTLTPSDMEQRMLHQMRRMREFTLER